MTPRATWSTAASVLLMLVAVVVQLRIGFGSLGGDLAGADPPAHFATGVLLYDYARHFPLKPPLPFAECFYVRYPKVALGHWPPAFYVAECLWFLCFGVSAGAARVMCAAVAACLGMVLWHSTSRHWGECTGLVVVAVLLTYPSMQQQAWQVMSDIFLALFVYLALVRLGAWMADGAVRHLWWLALWTFVAILTKGTGWLLLVVVLAAPAFSGRTVKYRECTYWLSIALPAAAAAPFFVYVQLMHLGYPVLLAHQIAALGRSAVGLLTRIGLLVLVTVIAYALPRRLPRRPSSDACLAMALWVAVQLAFRIGFWRMTNEWDRFFIPSLAPSLFLSAGFVSGLAEHTKDWRLSQTVLAPILGACAMALSGLVLVHPVTGYAAAMDSIPLREVGPVIWVQSDPAGEGAAIVRRLETDHARSAYVLRGRKMLADSSWSGHGYRLLRETPEAVDTLLNQIPVDFILFDTSVPPTADTELVRRCLLSSGSKFSARSAYPVRGRARVGEIRVYERRSSQLLGPKAVEVMLGPERGHRMISCPEPQR